MNILVVRLGAMGDVIHALPAVASLKSIPGARITWAISPRWAPLLEGNPFVDQVIPVDRKSVAGLRRAARELRATHFDLAVDLQGLMQSAVIARMSRAPRVIGFHRSQTREGPAAIAYTQVVDSRSVHVVDRYLDLARAAGAANAVKAFPLPVGVPEGDLPAGGYVLACPLAGWVSKQWPIEYYADLARRLPLPLVVNGAPASAEELARISGAHVCLSGIGGLIHATRRAVAVIGVDSGPLHLAAALGKPGVAIFGPTDPARNGPYGGTVLILRDSAAVTTYKRSTQIDPSMRAITPTAVWAALQPMLRATVSPA